MKTSDFKNKWDCLRNQKGYVQRVDPNHPMDFFVGISEKGYDEMVLFTVQEPALIKSGSALEITKNQRKKDNKWATQICSTDKNNQDIFARLCLDLVESSQNVKTEQAGLNLITKRFLAWQRLFATMHTGLPKHVLKGLVGELSFAVEVLSKHYSWDDIMLAWLGPDGADRDYVFCDYWFEIKSVATGKDKMTVSSLNQLETTDLGFLVKYDVDESSATDPNAISVTKMVDYIRTLLSCSPNAAQIFEQKLVSIGYIDRSEYNEVFFSHKEPVFYMVDDVFPRIITASVPPEIVGVQYDLSLAGIDPWRKDVSEIWN